MDFAFDPKALPAANLARIGTREVAAALAIAADEARPVDVRIHDARTHCKKARALLRLVRHGFPGWREENGAIRDAAKLLSGPRDSAVLLKTLEPFTAEAAYEPAEAQQLRAALASAGPGERSGTAALAGFVDHIRSVVTRAPAWPATDLDWPDIAEGAAQTYAQARRAMDRADETGAAIDFHEWRKQVKYHMHQLSLLRRFDTDHFRGARQLAKMLAMQLGAHHDLEMLGVRLQDKLVGHDALRGRLGEEIAARQLTIAHSALARGAELFAARPKDWRTSLARQIAGTLRSTGATVDA